MKGSEGISARMLSAERNWPRKNWMSATSIWPWAQKGPSLVEDPPIGTFGVEVASGVALLALQIYASPRYLARFSAGPTEALWRRLTYGCR